MRTPAADPGGGQVFWGDTAAFSYVSSKTVQSISHLSCNVHLLAGAEEKTIWHFGFQGLQ